jgi:hypothetical protein
MNFNGMLMEVKCVFNWLVFSVLCGRECEEW